MVFHVDDNWVLNVAAPRVQHLKVVQLAVGLAIRLRECRPYAGFVLQGLGNELVDVVRL